MREIIVASMLPWILVLITLVAGQEDLSSKYIGCFHGDGTSSTTETVRKNVAILSIATCIDECLRDTLNPMTFAGLKNGTACVCMNDTGIHVVPDTACSANCSGSSNERCGGIGPTTVPIYSIYTVCPIGYFGRGCDVPCHCKWQLPCDRSSGFCQHGCEEHWRGTSCSTRYVNTTLEYIGCFKDKRDQPAMDEQNPGGKTGSIFRNTTIEICIDICASLNVAYSFAGLQYHYECWCGNQYDRYRDDRTAVCSEPCTGNRNQICGGSWANSVYNVCPTGFYGRNCLSRCNCRNGTERCNNNRCSSSCKPGWKSESCNVRDCSINNGDCRLRETCEEVNLGNTVISQCRCKNGYVKVEHECIQIAATVHDHYVGCYKMGATTAATYNAISLPLADKVTVTLCVDWCRRLNKTFSMLTSLQNEMKCTCTDDLGESLPDNECKPLYLEGQQKSNTRIQDSNETRSALYSVYSVCSIGSFGIHCDKKCHCLRDSPCKRTSGNCYTNCSKHWIGPSCDSSRFLSPHYLGCFREGRWDEPKAFAKHYTGDSRRNNSIESCAKMCLRDNYTIIGLQYMYDCHCGEPYDPYGELPDSECRMPCTGNRQQKCGGSYANSVYALCPFGTYGRNCSDQCNCAEGADCTLINGSCPGRCKPGWTGSKCNNTVTEGRWCSTVSGECPDDETCADIDLGYVNISRCRCKTGFSRSLLQGICTDIDECADNTACSSAFNCTNTVGSFYCSYCPLGYINRVGECEIPLEYSTHDVIMAAACSAACMALLSIAIGAVLFLQLRRRYRKERQQNVVPQGEPVAYYTTYAETSDEPAYSTAFEGTSKEPSYYTAMRQAEGRGEHDYTTISA